MIGVGIDAVELDRFRNVLARTPTLTERVFTTAERGVARWHVSLSHTTVRATAFVIAEA